jgi:NAD(P)-dependent dehydrogenase (short-subunit alcohol dehydrogenase family)
MMATTLLIGSDDGLLEGIAQALGAAGHRSVVARSIAEAVPLVLAHQPLVVVVERDLARDPEFFRLRLPASCAIVAYHVEDAPVAPLPGPIQRSTLAELLLPWERQRLITLVKRVEDRALATGRAQAQTPPENRAV